MPKAGQQRLVVLQDGHLSSMARSTETVREFPFLRKLRNMVTGSGCSSCKRTAEKAKAFNEAKAAVASMGSKQKNKLKQRLNAKKIRVVYKIGNTTHQITF